jgi:hypothetical protein
MKRLKKNLIFYIFQIIPYKIQIFCQIFVENRFWTIFLYAMFKILTLDHN